MLKNSHRFEIGKCIETIVKKATWPVLVLSIVDILIITGKLSDIIIKVFSINTDEGIYWLLLFLSKHPNGAIVLWTIFIIFVIVFIAGAYLQIKDYCKRKLLMIKHSSLNAMNFKVDELELKDYSIKELVLDQCETMENAQLALNDRIGAAITEQIDILKKAKKLISKGYSLAYVGIAHTPLIFLLGFMLGDENGIRLFHKRRDDARDDEFHLLSPANYSETLSKQAEQIDIKQFDTVLLCIETTFKISDDDIAHIRDDNDYVLRYSTANKGYDVIYSAKQINEYVKMIKGDLHEICKSKHVKKVKICIASSVAFTFALAQSFSVNHDPKIEVFHYDTKSYLKYPWGINITQKKAIITGADHGY